ncbi:hypothetical protein B0O99DRAFT_634167 [Bisporella sp. PMI_857]|nr:hypothetical protein B0O99DRAFT_634167 [Bisporella sp. PMI_857]
MGIDRLQRSDPVSHSWLWYCCNCSPVHGPSDSALLERCLECQHERCNNCAIDITRNRNGRPVVIRSIASFNAFSAQPPSGSIATVRTTQSLPTQAREIQSSVELPVTNPSNSLLSIIQAKYGSEGNISMLSDPSDLPLVWHRMIVPPLAEKLQSTEFTDCCGSGFTISMLHGGNINRRKIHVMTWRPMSTSLQQKISEYTLTLFPRDFPCGISSTSFMFTTGIVTRLASVRGTSNKDLDQICEPRNPFLYDEPRMGDSIGLALGYGDDECTATLRPCLKIGTEDFWLTNLHPFATAIAEDPQWAEKIKPIEHPSPEDQKLCKHMETIDEHSRPLKLILGELTPYSSGPAYQTVKTSCDPYWEDNYLQPESVVTDWALCLAQGPRANVLRRSPVCQAVTESPPVISNISRVLNSATVYSTGRTSGFQQGQICFLPTFVSGRANSTGKGTYEWFVEQDGSTEFEDSWIKGGIGISGDSGAPVVDAHSHVFYGHVWGRNQYWGDGPRVAYFTPVMDIFEDIQQVLWGEKGNLNPPQLLFSDDSVLALPSQLVCKMCAETCYSANARDDLEDLLRTTSPSPAISEDLRKAESVSTGRHSVLEEEISTPKFDSEPRIGDGMDYSALAEEYPLDLPMPEWPLANDELLQETPNDGYIYPMEIGDEDLYGRYYTTTRSNARRKRKLPTEFDDGSIHQLGKRLLAA